MSGRSSPVWQRSSVAAIAAALALGCIDDLPADAEWDSLPVLEAPRPSIAVTNKGDDTLRFVRLGGTAEQTETLVVPVGAVPFEPEAPREAVQIGSQLVVVMGGEFIHAGFGPTSSHGTLADATVVEVLNLDNLWERERVTLPGAARAIAPVDEQFAIVAHHDLNLAIRTAADRADPMQGWSPVSRIDLHAGRVVRSRDLCAAPLDVVVDPTGSYAAVSCHADEGIEAIDVESLETQWRVDLAPASQPALLGPRWLQFVGPDDLIVGLNGSRELRRLGPGGETHPPIPLPGAPFYGVVLDDMALLVTRNEPLIVRVDLTEWTIQSTQPLDCEAPLRVRPHLDQWFVLCEGPRLQSGTLEVFSRDFELEQSIEVGPSPDDLVFVTEP